MSAAPQPGSGLSVLKIGGRLSTVPGVLNRVCAAVAEASRGRALLVVPGGGPFADAVRDFDGLVGLSADAAHWMAILAMDQYAHVLADRIAGAVLVEEPGAVSEVVQSGRVAVLAPSRWMRSADVLPHSWEVTSDSVAAFVAGALGAVRLVLIKPTASGSPVDRYFASALPSGMHYLVLSWDRVEELASCLSEQSAGAARQA